MATAIRVNAETLNKHIHEVVRIVGTVRDSESNPVTIISTDQQTISVHLSSNGTLPLERFKSSKWVEVTGLVQDDRSIQEDFTVPLPGEVNNEAWDQMVRLIEKHNEIFFDRK